MSDATAFVPPRLEMAYQGAEWIRDSLHRELSPLGMTVADALGYAYRGIYHLDTAALDRVDWKDRDMIAVRVPDGLATFDGFVLSDLVFVCFDLMLRLEIEAQGFRYLRLRFWQRTQRDGAMYERMPRIEQQLAAARGIYKVIGGLP